MLNLMELNIRIAGAAGQGMQTTADLLGKVLTRAGLFAYAYADNESRIRGGLNFTHLRCADRPLAGVTETLDLLVVLSPEALTAFAGRVAADGAILAVETLTHPRRAPIPIHALAEEAGSKRVEGVVALAVVAALLGLDQALLETLVRERFPEEPVQQHNLRAVALGYRAAAGWTPPRSFRLPQGDAGGGRFWIAGHEALSLGAVAGGVSFMAGYPMSPATPLLNNLAAWHGHAGIVVEQAEDEIAAINMVAGAAYAGARAMTATSGGGFALMVEGLSLLGMIEAPAVIVLGQRPGPATGLPTRTAQGDLNFARYAGHGCFPRILLAPRNIADCFEIGAHAFDLAERYQVPVIVLTDQLLQDSQATIEPLAAADLPGERHLLKVSALRAMPVYRRYEQAPDGLSPMAAPGDSDHVVVVDSDEHDEEGHLIEAADIAARMVRKRLRKAETVAQAAWAPDVPAQARGLPLVLGWGSSYETVAEACARVNAQGRRCAHLHLRWLWPLPEEPLGALLRDAPSVTVVENSPAGGLTALLREVALRRVDHEIRRLDGRPLTVDEVAAHLLENAG